MPTPREADKSTGRQSTGHTELVVVEISLGSDAADYDVRVDFLDRPYRLIRFGTAGDVRAAEELVSRWSRLATVVAVSGVHEAQASGLYAGDLDRARRRMAEASPGAVVTDGARLREVLQEWAVRRVHAEMPGYFNNARTLVLDDGHQRAVAVLREHTDNIHAVDLPLRAALTRRAAALTGPVGRAFLGDITHDDCDVVVGSYDDVAAHGFETLSGRTVLTSAVSAERLDDLAARDVDLVLDVTPQPFDVTVDAATLEAMMRAAVAAGGGNSERLTDDDLLEMIEGSELEPRMLQPNGPRRKSRFAFVIHPLSQKFFTKVEPLATVAKIAPQPVMDVVEKAVAYSPPFVYSHMTGIKSPTGAEAEGWLITVGGTPKELLAHDPEFTYDRLLAAAEMARKLGAQVMGLGAFTKVVGDAGVTVARKSSLPITTGNSYSASGALWAAHEAVDQLGLLERDDDGMIRGKAMVVGATGAIGSVCARLLALACDELWLVSPESGKLLALKEDIERESPRAVVRVAAKPDDHLAEMDVIVTATSGAGKRVLDIMSVKPGCVITQ